MDRLKYAENKLDEAIRNKGADDAAYLRGYRDCARRVGMTHQTAVDILRSANLAGVLRAAADMGIEALEREMGGDNQMKRIPRNDAFARCVNERYADQEDAPMEIKKPNKDIEDWTAKEIKAFCRTMIEPQGGGCPGDAIDLCPFYRNCQEAPDSWDLGEIPKITAQERRLLLALQELGVKKVGKTVHQDPLWVDQNGNWRLLPEGALPSIRGIRTYEISQLLSGKE